VRGVPPRNPSAAEVAVVAFAESQVNSNLVPRSTALTSVISVSGLNSQARGADPRARALAAVLGAWFDSRTDPTELYSALSLATGMQNDAAARRLASRMMAAAGVQGFYKGQALATLVRLKATDELPAVEKAFADVGVLTTTIRFVNGKQVRESIEVRDAALAAALVLTGQSPADYGFASYPRNAGATFSYTWARISEDGRKAAFEKWKAWREKNP
jgi:hypothetical protein